MGRANSGDRTGGGRHRGVGHGARVHRHRRSPGPYNAKRLRPGELDRFVVEHAVRLRGWPVPFVNNAPVQRMGEWVAQDVVASPHVEAWRMFSSGQFLQRRLLATELRHSAELVPNVTSATGAVAVWDVLFYLVEVAEFGARLATVLRPSR